MYYTISSFRRIMARTIDYLLISIFGFIFFFIINIYNFTNFVKLFHYSHNLSIIVPQWMFYSEIIFFIILIFIYFIVVPFFFSGQTLGKKIFKIFIIKKNLKDNLFFNLCKHEFFLSIFFIFILIVILISSFFIKQYNLNFFIWIDKNFFLKSFINSLYFINASIIVFIMLSLFLSKKGIGIHDIWSKTLVVSIWIKKINSKKNVNIKKITIKESLKNINSILENDQKA